MNDASVPTARCEPYSGDDSIAAADLVVLLDQNDQPSGTAPRATVHTTATPLHLAFSCYLFRDSGEVLLTRRALDKRTWPGVWSNSCCGHPVPGEELPDAVHRRVWQELGVHIDMLSLALPDFRYRAVDVSGIVENEVCPVFIGQLQDGHLSPNSTEVMETTWVSWPSLVALCEASPELISPWAALQIPELHRRFPAGLNPSQ